MRTLALDAATKMCTVALLEDGRVLAEYQVNMGLTHSEGLLPMLDQLFSRTGVARQDIGRIAVSIGPGSFTGLRIGLATAEALAYAWHCDICGVLELPALCYNLPVPGVLLAPVLDAQKGNYYLAQYAWEPVLAGAEAAAGAAMDDGEVPAGVTDGAAPAGAVGGLRLVEKMPIAILHKREILEKLAALGQPVLLLGECDKLAREALPANVRLVAPHLRLPRAGAVGLAADNPLCIFGTELSEMVPFYFRRSEAEELWEKRHPEAKQNPVEQAEITPCVHP